MLMNENQDKYLYANYDTKFEEKELGYVYIYNSRGLGDVVDTIALIEDASLMVHLFFFTLLGVKQYFGTPILCEVSQTNTTPRDKVEAYCWMQGNN